MRYNYPIKPVCEWLRHDCGGYKRDGDRAGAEDLPERIDSAGRIPDISKMGAWHSPALG